MQVKIDIADLVSSLDPHTAKVSEVKTKPSHVSAIVDYMVHALPEWFVTERGYNEVDVDYHGGTYIRIIVYVDDDKVDREDIVDFVKACFQDSADFVYDENWYVEDEDDDREDNPAKPGIRAARASEVAAEKEMRASWKAASDVMYGYAHGVYARETLDKYIDRFVAAVEAERGARDHLHEIEQARKGRTGNPSHSGLPLGSLALGAALGAAAMHFTMKPKQ